MLQQQKMGTHAAMSVARKIRMAATLPYMRYLRAAIIIAESAAVSQGVSSRRYERYSTQPRVR